jgi:hypothetical protein
LGGDQAEVPALARDGDGRGERGGDVRRHGGRWSVVGSCGCGCGGRGGGLGWVRLPVDETGWARGRATF